jgi:hypothetical protein
MKQLYYFITKDWRPLQNHNFSKEIYYVKTCEKLTFKAKSLRGEVFKNVGDL